MPRPRLFLWTLTENTFEIKAALKNTDTTLLVIFRIIEPGQQHAAQLAKTQPVKM